MDANPRRGEKLLEQRVRTWPVPFDAASAWAIFFAISAFTASRLKLAPLHRRVDRGERLGVLARDQTPETTRAPERNLNQSKYCCAPSLVHCSASPCAFERIQARIGDVGYVRAVLFPSHPGRLVVRAVLVRRRCAPARPCFRPDRRSRRRTDGPVPVMAAAGSAESRWILYVQPPIVLPFSDFVGDVRIAGPRPRTSEASRGRKRYHSARCPPERGPADDHRRHAEAAFEHRSLALREQRLAAIGPGEDLGAVVGGGGDDDRLSSTPMSFSFFMTGRCRHRLGHAGFLVRPAVVPFASPRTRGEMGDERVESGSARRRTACRPFAPCP